MSVVEQFEQICGNAGAAKTASAATLLDAAEKTLLNQKDYHRVFDVKLIRARHELGLPIARPTSLKDIPADREASFRAAYTQAARDVGSLFLKNDQLIDAWAYFRTIHETQPVRDAITERVKSLPIEPGPHLDELLNLALYEGAHIVEGLKLMLRTHGTCNTVTAMSQFMAQMSPDERRQAAAMMVRNVYGDLVQNVRRDVERRQLLLKPDLSLGALITGREFLFADGNYHIDVSHLHSTVSFARHLQAGDSELQMAIDMCDYGRQLAEQLRYPADVPFDDFYVANGYFLKALAGQAPDESMNYFIDRLNQEPDAPDKQMIAFVIVDLGQRIGRVDRALEVAGTWVSQLEDPAGFSFTAFCVESGRLDVLESSARAHDDVLALTTALLAAQAPRTQI